VAVVVVIAGGFLLGLLVGRWWTLAAPIAFAVWDAATRRVDPFGAADISWGAAAFVISVWASVGVVLGLALRRIGVALLKGE
jgi:hypothetical protein